MMRVAPCLETPKDLYADHAEPGALCQCGQDGLHTLVICIADLGAKSLWLNGHLGCAREDRAFTL